ncbi:hypothetical protein Tco_0901444, partial [Tanacetum coccineum]
SPPVRRALSSRLKLRHLRKVRVRRKDADISSGIGLHVPSFFTSRSTISIGSSTKRRFSSISISSKAGDKFPGRHVARDKSSGKARWGYVPGRHRRIPGDILPGKAYASTLPCPGGFDLNIVVTESLDPPPLAHTQIFLVKYVLETLVTTKSSGPSGSANIGALHSFSFRMQKVSYCSSPTTCLISFDVNWGEGGADLEKFSINLRWRLDKWEGDTCHTRRCSSYAGDGYEVLEGGTCPHAIGGSSCGSCHTRKLHENFMCTRKLPKYPQILQYEWLTIGNDKNTPSPTWTINSHA